MTVTPSRLVAGALLFGVAAALALGACTKLDDLVQPTCTYAVTPATSSFDPSGGPGTVNVTAAGACGWSTGGAAPWITIMSGTSGNGNGTVAFTVAANDTSAMRRGTLMVAGQMVTITQAAPSTTTPCSYSVAPASATYGAGGGSGSVTVTTASGCAWTASSSASWITTASGSGTGTGSVNYTVAANTASVARTGALTIAGQTVTITQAAASTTTPCAYSVAPTTAAYDSTGGSGAVTVTTANGCAWTASSSASWITMAPASGTGTGSVNYTVAANTASAGRTGTLVVGGQTVTISQAGVPPACAYTVSPLTATYPSAGGSGAVTVATTSACGWTAVSADNWITITSGASGSGNGTVSYSVQANLGLLARSGTLTVAGQTVTISQAGLLGGP